MGFSLRSRRDTLERQRNEAQRNLEAIDLIETNRRGYIDKLNNRVNFTEMLMQTSSSETKQALKPFLNACFALDIVVRIKAG